jgi:hypothetical protein
MRPIRIDLTNHTYHGPTLDIADLPCRRVRPGLIASWWRPDEADRAAIAAGADILLQISAEPIPPVSVGVSPGGEEIAEPFRHEPGDCTVCDQARAGG